MMTCTKSGRLYLTSKKKNVTVNKEQKFSALYFELCM